MGNFLGIDYGARHMGLAIADEHARQAFPRTVLEVHSVSDALSQLQSFIDQEDVCKIIVGRPLNLSGEPTDQTQEVDTFIRALAAQHPSVPIATEDERYSTTSALHALKAKGETRATSHPDAVAAMLILETYLERTHDQ